MPPRQVLIREVVDSDAQDKAITFPSTSTAPSSQHQPHASDVSGHLVGPFDEGSSVRLNCLCFGGQSLSLSQPRVSLDTRVIAEAKTAISRRESGDKGRRKERESNLAPLVPSLTLTHADSRHSSLPLLSFPDHRSSCSVSPLAEGWRRHRRLLQLQTHLTVSAVVVVVIIVSISISITSDRRSGGEPAGDAGGDT